MSDQNLPFSAAAAAVKSLLPVLFYGIVFMTILKIPTPAVPKVQPQVLKDYYSGNEKTFMPLGIQYSVFKRMLPPDGPVTFLIDYPFGPYTKGIEKLYTAQSYLTPRLLNPEPVERAAIVDCENYLFADKRLQETGYNLIAVVADGKGMAVKK